MQKLAIFYGYPSLVNSSRGDGEKAAAVFAPYDVVVWGDGLEFSDRQAGRHPEGDPTEHEKALLVINAAHRTNPTMRFYGYVCLGEIPGVKVVLSEAEMKERIRLWRQMGAAGIFLDEAGYDFAGVTRERQNAMIQFIHGLGMSAFMNAYFVEDLFGTEGDTPHAGGGNRNPKRLPSALDGRDLFLLESFPIANGSYQETSTWQERLQKALGYRERFGVRIFATTTAKPGQTFDPAQFDFAWWCARLHDLDGFGWGEPEFSARDNQLPWRDCKADARLVADLETDSSVSSDGRRFWRQAGKSLILLNAENHTVEKISGATGATGTGAARMASGVALNCSGPK
jgi:hypothetical protein